MNDVGKASHKIPQTTADMKQTFLLHIIRCLIGTVLMEWDVTHKHCAIMGMHYHLG